MKPIPTLLCAISISARQTVYSVEQILDPLERVKAYETIHNSDDIEAIMGMFAEEAVFELVGQGVLPNLEAIRAIHEYDKGIQARIAFQNCAADGLTVTCQVTEQNEWLSAAGIGAISYTSSIFTFTETGKIQKLVAAISPEDGAAIGAILAEFIPWLMAERPQESAPLFSPDGQFIYSEANGILVVELLHQWQAER